MATSWTQTYCGHKFSALSQNPGTIDIRDIARGLSHQPRFCGQTKEFYSVAQHSCHVAYLSPSPLKLAALLHDASEAYICDLPRPLKHAVGMSVYRQAEDNIMKIIAQTFNFPWPMPDEIKKADDIALATEARDLLGTKVDGWGKGLPDPDPQPLVPLDPRTAENIFLDLFAQFASVGD